MRLAALLLVLLFATPALSQTAEEALIEAGMRIYKTDGANCEHCHYWSGRGWQHNQLYSAVPAGGPSLVDSKMTREQMVEMIACGRYGEGSIMPMYRGEAWTRERPCWGQVAADIKAPLQKPLWGYRMLSYDEINAVVAYIQAVYQGNGMSRDWCRKFFPGTPRACEAMN